MGTILDSTKELSKKLGVEAEEQTIKDQIDAINASIDENFDGSVDIAEAVRTYSENAGGGGAGFTSVMVPFADFSQTSKFISRVYLRRSDTGIYDLSDIPTSNVMYVILLDPAKEITGLTNYQTYAIFTPHKDFVISTPSKGDTVTAGDGRTYYVNYKGGSFEYVKIPSLPGGSGISNTFTVDIE